MAEKTHALLLAGALVFSGCVAGRRADGDRYMEQARYPAAVRAYQDVLQRRPGDLRAQVGQARALLRTDQPQAALEPARMAMEQADPQGIALYAEALIRTGDAETALTLLAQPDAIPDGWRLLAEARLSTGDPAAAMSAALETPDRALLAWCALRAGERQAAMATAEGALNRPPSDPGQRAELSGVLLALGIAVEVEIPDDERERWLSEAARRQAAGDLEGALRMMSRLRVSQPDNPSTSAILGALWLQVEAPELARRALEDSLNVDPAQPEVWTWLAQTCTALAAFDCAGVAWEGRLQHGPPFEEGWALAGQAWTLAENNERRLVLWQRAVEDRPTAPERLSELAQAYASVGELDLATGYARRAWEYAPQEAAYALLLMQYLQMRGDDDAAERVRAAGLRSFPDDIRFRTGR